MNSDSHGMLANDATTIQHPPDVMKNATGPAAALAALTVLGASSNAAAQLGNLAEASAEHAPAAEVDGVRDRTGEPIMIGMSAFRVQASLPLPLAEGGPFLAPGFGYGLRTFSTPSAELTDLHRFTLSLRSISPLGSGWLLMLGVSPTLATTFEKVSSRHVRLGGVSMLSHEFSPVFSGGLGAVVNRSFGEVLPLPALLLRWEPSESFRAVLFAPVFAEVAYVWKDRLEVGLHAVTDGDVYTTGEGQGVPGSDRVRFSNVRFGGSLGARLVSTLWLRGYAGVLALRRFEIEDRNGNTLLDLALKAGPVFGAQVQLRLPPRPEQAATE